MIERTDFVAPGLALLLGLYGMSIAASSPVWAAGSIETSVSQSDLGFAPAKALVDAGKYDEALAALQGLNTRSPDNPDVLNLIGFSLRKTGYVDAALDYYKRALALKPDHLGANEYLGELYLQLGQPEKAKQRLEALRQACADCEEFRDLQAKIEQTAKAN